MKKIHRLLPVLIFISSFIILFMMFLPALKNESENIMNGTKAVFGGKITQVGEFLSADVKFSFLNLLAYTLPAILSILFTFTALRYLRTTNTKLFLNILIFFSFVLSIFLFNNLNRNTVGVTTILGVYKDFNYESSYLGAGAIIAMITSIVGAILTALYFIIDIGLPSKFKRI